MAQTNTTLDRIQKEIRESVEREKELKNCYTNKQQISLNHNNNNNINNNNNNNVNGVNNESSNNGITTILEENIVTLEKRRSNGFSRKFVPNSNNNNKYLMQKFLKSRGKMAPSFNNVATGANSWGIITDAAFAPAKITVEKDGKPIRNGFIPAEEKIKRELQDFQQRESELRQERKKSQPNLMAALQLEDNNEFESRYYLNETMNKSNSSLKPAKSMANLYSFDDDFLSETHSSASSSLKPARSLAELCDVSDNEDIELPGTHSLIRQFENMKNK